MVAVQTWEPKNGGQALIEHEEVETKAAAVKLIERKRAALEKKGTITNDYSEDWPGFVARVNGVPRVVMMWIE